MPITNWDNGGNYDTGLSWDPQVPVNPIGTAPDIVNRLLAVLPPWFGNAATPVLNAVLQAFASVGASVYFLIAYVAQQTRIATATDGFLDLIALDFFGRRIQRFAGELDSAFSARIQREVLRSRGTIAAVRQMLIDLTGRPPIILEPWRPASSGGYGVACGYGVAGAYGSEALPGQLLVTAYRPFQNTGGAIDSDGYGGSYGGYGVGAIQYSAQPQSTGGEATDAAIYDAVHSVIPAGVIAWVNIQS